MQLTHRFRLPAPVEEVFEAFSHLEQLAPCFPGATVASAGEDQLTGTLAVKLGSVPLLYTGTGSYRERSALRHRIVVQAHGEDSRGLGTAVAVLTTHLTGRGNETDVEVVTELDLTGKPARFGTAVVSEVSDKLFDQFSSCLAERLGGGAGAALAAEVAAPAVDPTAPAGAVGDVPPPPVRPRRARRSAPAAPDVPARAGGPSTLVRRYGPALAGAVVVTGLGLWLVRRLS